MSAQRGLDACPNDAELLRRHEAQQRAGYVRVGNLPIVRTELTIATSSTHPVYVSLAPEWPILLRIPWSLLVSDNAKYGVVKGRMLLSRPYRAAKAEIAKLAREAMHGYPPSDLQLQLIARVWMPDNRAHDLTNFCKIAHDGMERAIYSSDRQLYDVHWVRIGVDVDAPRAEIEIRPLTQGSL